MLFFGCTAAFGQLEINDTVIGYIVKHEREYFNEITKLYNDNDPMLHVDDIALVYYGQAFLPQYNPGKDKNEQALKRLYEEKKNVEIYNTAKQILTYNPVSLNALFSIYIASKELGKSDEECISYLKKYQNIIDMICHYGDGKSSETPFRIITPDDLTVGLLHSFNQWYVWMSIIKSIFFAFIISSVASYYGYYVEGGSFDVGKASTNAVVSSSMLILFSDIFLTSLLS